MRDTEPEGASPPTEDHKFEPRSEPIDILILGQKYTLMPNQYLCKHCRLAEAAHVE